MISICNNEENKISDKESLRIRRIKVEVKSKMIEYDEYYLVNDNDEEIFNRDIEI